MLDRVRVVPGDRPELASRDTAGVPDLDLTKEDGKERLGTLQEEIGILAQRLYGEDERAVLLVLQGMDTSGKDGVIRESLAGVAAPGVKVTAFKAPSATELAHDYLWRIHAACPSRGEIGVLNRSHYEDVVAVRVRGLAPEERWRRRFEHIRNFETMLTDEGTAIVKCFLHLSRDEQRVRLQERLDDPEKRWKFRLGDLDDRARWDDYQAVWDDTMAGTGTDAAPWHVVPADRRWLRNLVAAEVVADTLRRLDPKLPQGDPSLDDVVVT